MQRDRGGDRPRGRVLGLSAVDYLTYSVDALFVPLPVTAVAGLLAVWGTSLLRARLATRPSLAASASA